MERQLIVITQAEIRGLKYGQDLVTEICQDIAATDSLLHGSQGYIDGLLERMVNGEKISVKDLHRLRDDYIGAARKSNLNNASKGQLLWRKLQDEENAERYEKEIERGVNR